MSGGARFIPRRPPDEMTFHLRDDERHIVTYEGKRFRLCRIEYVNDDDMCIYGVNEGSPGMFRGGSRLLDADLIDVAPVADLTPRQVIDGLRQERDRQLMSGETDTDLLDAALRLLTAYVA